MNILTIRTFISKAFVFNYDNFLSLYHINSFIPIILCLFDGA